MPVDFDIFENDQRVRRKIWRALRELKDDPAKVRVLEALLELLKESESF